MRIKYFSFLSIIVTLTLSGVSLAHAQTAASSYEFNQNLTIGSTGPEVIALQQFLITKGFLTSITTPTGYFGNGTQAALARFQAANGISPAAGYCGPETRTLLNLSDVAPSVSESSSIPNIGGTTTSTTNIETNTNQTSSQNDPPIITINPQVIVGVLCYYDTTITNQSDDVSVPADYQEEVRGSGVIIDSQGDILTNRHIVVQPDEYTSVTDSSGNTIPVTISYQLDHCEVGQLPADAQLPTTDQIQTINPYIQVPVLGYTAQPAYISPTAGLSNNEIAEADFAVLKITGISQSGPTFGVTSVPSSFPYATFLAVKPYPQIDGLVVTYGFPGDVTAGQGNFFQTMTMTGSVGHVTSIDSGDTYYADTPLTIYTDMEIAHGRSGSPLFWRGYVIGIVTFYENNNRTDSGSVATDAIAKGLALGGYNLSLADSSIVNGISQSSPPVIYPDQQSNGSAENGYQSCSSDFPNSTWGGAYNSNGSYVCVCPNGDTWNSDQTACIAQSSGYQACLDDVPNSTWDGTYLSNGNYDCVCNDGYVASGGQCVPQPSCPLFSTYNSDTNSCQCWSGYQSVGDSCESDLSVCQDLHGFGATYDAATNQCACTFGYLNINNQCESGYLYCSEIGEEFNPLNGGSCYADNYNY